MDQAGWEMKADEILDVASIGLAQRAKLRDQPNGERSAARAADILSAWLGKEVTEAEVWMTLMAVKLSRSVQGKFHADDYVDLAGYAALLGECEANNSE